MTTERAFQRKTTQEAMTKQAIDVAMSPIEAKKAERSELENELVEKRHQLKELENESPTSYKDLKGQSENVERLLFETGALEEKIKIINEEIQTLELQAMAELRSSILKEAEVLAEEKKKLFARIDEINIRGLELQAKYDENIPRRRVQTSSSQSLHWEKMVQDSHIKGLTWRGETIPETTLHREEAWTDALPYRVKSMQKAGWNLMEGQEVHEEPLTPENSRLVETIPMPDMFDSFWGIEFVRGI